MAFLRRGIGDNDSDIDPGALRTGTSGKILRWVAVPCLGVAVVCWSVATLAGLHSAASLAYGKGVVHAGLPMLPKPAAGGDAAGKAGRIALAAMPESAPAEPAAAAKAPVDPFAEVVARAKISREKMFAAFVGTSSAKAASDDPFAKVAAEAKLSREKLLAAFADAGMAVDLGTDPAAAVQLAAVDPDPLAARFQRPAEMKTPGARPPKTGGAFPHLAIATPGLGSDLAYASVEPSPDPFELALASLGDPLSSDPLADPLPGGDAGVLLEDMPERVDVVPTVRPEPAKPARKPAGEEKPARAEKPAREEEPQRELAYARPDNPAGGIFKNLFNTPKAGDKVAIYDISAAVVHMPDGTKLEAHSGIGKMADNPRYVHVKNKGPTPPNTYKLSMREKLFHGVQAIRMTPIGEQTMHGRDGMLAHSYLLRGGREESHGCVAFANYPKFLKAFKQGKITHMIVVPSMSKMPKVQLVSNRGRGA